METCGIRPDPAPVRPDPKPKVRTMYTPEISQLNSLRPPAVTHVAGLLLFFVLTKFVSLEIGMITLIAADACERRKRSGNP